jgi:hypothetical protein
MQQGGGAGTHEHGPLVLSDEVAATLVFRWH